jgi:hypothetical protein
MNIQKIRKGEISFKKLYSLLNEKLDKIQKKKPYTNDYLIDKIVVGSNCYDILNKWIINLRKNSLIKLVNE